MANELPEAGDNGQIFYNVLPPEKASGPLANAGPGAMANASEVAAAAEGPLISSSAASGSRMSGLVGKQNLIIAAEAIVILGTTGFFAYRWATKPAEEPVPAPINTEPPPPESQQPEGVTTPLDWQRRYFG